MSQVERTSFEEAFVAWCEYFLESDTLDSVTASVLWTKTKEQLSHLDALIVNAARQEAQNLTPRGRRDIVQLRRKCSG